MSQLRVSSINHPSAPSGGIVLAADGNVSGGGMDFITSSTFSAVSSVSVNDCFSSDYDNYMLSITYAHSQNGNISIRLRAASADDSTAVYDYGGDTSASSATSGVLFRAAPGPSIGIAHIFGPALAEYTRYRTIGHQGTTAGFNYHGVHRAATAYDGFTAMTDGGTYTGTIRVYGYKN